MCRNRKFSMFFAWICFILVLVVCGFPGSETASADDAKELLKQFNQDLRQAQNDMFAGKSEQAVESLGTLKGLLDRVEAVDPNNPQLKGARSKYTKLLKDLERRTGRDLGGATTTVAAGTPTKLPPKPEAKPMPAKAPVPESAQTVGGAAEMGTPAAKTQTVTQATSKADGAAGKLPYHARKPFETAQSRLGRVGSYVERLSNPDYPGDKNQLVSNANKMIADARSQLEEARQKAAEGGVTSYPQFDQMEADLAAAETELQAAVATYEKDQTAAAASADEVNQDVEVLRQVYQRHLALFQKATGTVPYYNDLQPLGELISEIEAFEKNDQAAVQRQLDDFSAKYGATREEIDKKADTMGYSGEGRAGYPYQELTQGIENIQKTRELTADDILRRAKDKQSNASQGLHDFSRIEGHATIKAWGEMAARFDPQSPRVKEFNSGLGAWIQSDLAALDAKIDRAAWPQQASDSPGDAAQLTRIAKEFLQRQAEADSAKGKAPRTIVAVVITGPWRIFTRNILGEPIQYGLPVVVGEQWEVEKDMNRVRAYQMSMLTEEYKGVKMAPPFIGAAVGDSFYVRPGNIK